MEGGFYFLLCYHSVHTRRRGAARLSVAGADVYDDFYEIADFRYKTTKPALGMNF